MVLKYAHSADWRSSPPKSVQEAAWRASLPNHVRAGACLNVNDEVLCWFEEWNIQVKRGLLKIARKKKSAPRDVRLTELEALLRTGKFEGFTARSCAAHLIRAGGASFETQKLDSLRKEVVAVRKKLARQQG